MASTLSASVIVCTRNRAVSLSETLRALGRLEVPAGASLEIIVVDNASLDDTRAIVINFAESSPIEVRYVYEPRPGLSEARNRAIAVARGSLLLFTDDDCLPAPDWVMAAFQVFADNYRQVMAGRVELHDPRDIPLTIKTSLAGETLTSHHALHGFLHGCNMTIGRQVFQEIGPFDVRLGAGTSLVSGEDTDLVYRALRAGIKVSYDPRLVVFHNHGRRTMEEHNRIMRGYKVGMGALAMKHLLDGDIGPARNCYWELRSALRIWTKGKIGLAYLLTESHLVLGAIKFSLRADLVRSKRGAAARRYLRRVAFRASTGTRQAGTSDGTTDALGDVH